MRFSTPAFLILGGSASVSYCQAQEIFKASASLSYSKQEEACADKGRRLCTLGELCLSRDNYNYPFNQVFTPSFTLPSNFDGSAWVAYEQTNDGDGNCSAEGGCNDNSWVMMGVPTSNFLCNSHCEVVRREDPNTNNPQCPNWGSTGSPNYVCCEVTTADDEPTIQSWDLELTSVNSEFDKDSDDEITLSYKIGKDRQYEVFMLKEDCSTSITENVVTHSSSTSDIEGDTSNSNLLVSVDIVKSSIATSNIWVGTDSTDKVVKLCAKVHLISSGSGSVIKELERVIEVKLDFENNFQTIQNATFDKISLLSNETQAAVDDYIKACTCDGSISQPFTCNTNILGVDDLLNICLESLDAEMQINYLDSLKMVQGDNTLNIVSSGSGLVDGDISSKTTRADESGVHVASIIPASFFSYENSGTAEVSGVVFLKLSGSRRRLAAEIDRALQSSGDQESAFSMEVQLEKNDLGVAEDSNGAINAVVTGLIAGPTAVVTAAAAAASYLMWMW